MIKLLTFTSLYPNNKMPQLGVFVENRLVNLVKDSDVESKVVSPVPWFPFNQYITKEYARYKNVTYHDVRNGIEIIHPRYFHIPFIGMNIQAIFMALSVYPKLKKIIHDGYDFDVIDAHYFYPDGVAATILGKLLNKPVVITARGSDLNVYTYYTIPRLLIRWAAEKASALITVCQALKDVLLSLSVDNNKVTVIRNGVDLEKFFPLLERENLRDKLGVNGRVLLMVGRLVNLKGHHLAIRALVQMDNTCLLIAGDGIERPSLERLVCELKLTDRVKFLGSVEHTELQQYYSIADALLLVSSSEGWANVILEAMACGTPVVATNVGGTSEIVLSPEAGVLIDERSVDGVIAGISKLFANYPDRNKTREFAEKFSWLQTSILQKTLFLNLKNNIL